MSPYCCFVYRSVPLFFLSMMLAKTSTPFSSAKKFFLPRSAVTFEPIFHDVPGDSKKDKSLRGTFDCPKERWETNKRVKIGTLHKRRVETGIHIINICTFLQDIEKSSLPVFVINFKARSCSF